MRISDWSSDVCSSDLGTLVGTIQCWPVMHRAPGGAASPLVMVGPVAVRPDVQNDGHGRALMAQMLTAAETGADGALMLIGDPDYYGRFFAFPASATGAWALPGPFQSPPFPPPPPDGPPPPTRPGR